MTRSPDRSSNDDGSAVALDGVTRVFGLTVALARVDLRVETGETVLVLGANGAGKSTLLAVAATALVPTFGAGCVMGFDLLRERESIRRHTELLGHRTRHYPDLTAAENLRFWSSLMSRRDGGGQGVAAALDRVGLLGQADERVRTFSHGMRQRLAIARTTLRRPDLLLLDEPYAGLDTEGKDLVDELIAETRGDGRTVILATHEPLRARELADREIWMTGGRIVPADTERPEAKIP